MKPKPIVIDPGDAEKAWEEWGMNCGPGAVCGVVGLRPDEVRKHLFDFELKHYTNPTLMNKILLSLGVDFCLTYRSDSETFSGDFPALGLVRVQWGGPWTKPGVPKQARYRHSHWIGTNGTFIFDVNAISHNGGWIEATVWKEKLAPWLIRECCPKGDGKWWPTHCLTINQERGGATDGA